MEWTVVGENSSGNNLKVEHATKHDVTDGDASESLVDGEEVAGEGTTEEDDSDLEHGGEALHDEIELPGIQSVHLALSISTAVNERSTLLRLGINFEPPFAQHHEEHSEKGNAQTGVKRGLDTDSVGNRTRPLRGDGNGTSLGMTKRYVGNNLEEAVAQLCVIRLETGLSSDDESGRDGGEQTGLVSGKTCLRHDPGGCKKRHSPRSTRY